LLGLDPVVQVPAEQHHDRERRHQHAAEVDQEFLLPALAFPLAPRQQVDACHQSKLLIASPQAIIMAGASLASASASTLLASAMSTNGLAIKVGVPSLFSIMSASPSMDAVPPASTM